MSWHSKSALFLILAAAVALSGTSRAHARNRGLGSRPSAAHSYARGYGDGWHNFEHRGSRYFFHNGLFFRRSGLDFLITLPPIGAVIPVLPFGYVTFSFGPGITYYYMDGVYYRPVPEGYLIVPEDEVNRYKEQQNSRQADVIPDSSGSSADGDFTVNVPNSDGSYSPVKLKHSKGGYTGPQGEFYKGNPSVEQLKVLYGR